MSVQRKGWFLDEPQHFLSSPSSTLSCMVATALVQVLFATYLEYTKMAGEATDLAELGVLGMGVDPLEDCPACADAP